MPSSVVEDETTAGSGPVPVTHLFDTILILDFGSQYSHLITRRLREINVYAEMLPCTQKISELTWKPKGTIPLTFGTDGTGIILSGSPYSVYAEDAPHSDPELFDLGVPVLGICYGLCVFSRF
jgi:GMP synthase (glutamine-hydrolysing)